MKPIIRSQVLKTLKQKYQRSFLTIELILKLSINLQKNIFTYISLPHEADTIQFIQKNYKNNTIIVPIIKNNDLILSQFTSFVDCKKNKFGILEPQTIIPIHKELIDLWLIPGVAFDIKGNRIGYGKGYFDRLLKNIDAPKIGIAFESQLVKKIPIEPHDIPMDYIITEKRIMRCL